MASHTPYEAILRLSARHWIRSSALLLACLLPHRSVAQSTTSLQPDATVLPSREVRFRVLSAWTRYDDLLGTGPLRNIGSILATDSLTSARVPLFVPIETNIRAASGLQNFQLTAGNVVSPANSRIVTAPLIVEYGVTSRLTLGVVIPLVETRTTFIPQLNPLSPSGSAANVGPNPAALGNSLALAQNFLVVQTVRSATSTLQTRLSACQATPTGTGCDALLAQQSAALALIQTSGTFTSVLERLYGTDPSAHPGQAYVPLANSAVETAIDNQVQALATQLRALLGTDVTVGKMSGANGPGAFAQLQQIFRAVGRDSLTSTDRASIGDISVGATLQLLNSFGDTSAAARRVAYRLSVNGTFRIGTGEPADQNRVFDVATGYGQNGIEGGVAADVRLGRWLSGSVLGSYTTQLGSIAVPRVPGSGNGIYPLALPFNGTYSAGNVMQFSIIPRIRLAGYFGLTGQYSLIRAAADRYTIDPTPTMEPPAGPVSVDDAPNPQPTTPFGLASATAQQLGFGFCYSTIVGPNRGPGAIPFEVTFNHFETIAGSGGPVNKTFRDQIQLKLYWGRKH